MSDNGYREFVQSVIDNVKKNGFPEKKVAFPLERMYALAYEKGINFNKVLDTLDGIQIAHHKTPEKIIFYAKDRFPAPVEENETFAACETNANSEPFPHMDPVMFKNFNPEMLKGMNMGSVMDAAQNMMKNISPEQLKSIRDMYDSMSDEERASLLENAKKFGLF